MDIPGEPALYDLLTEVLRSARFFPALDVELLKDGQLHIIGTPRQVRDIIARKVLTVSLQMTTEWTGRPSRPNRHRLAAAATA